MEELYTLHFDLDPSTTNLTLLKFSGERSPPKQNKTAYLIYFKVQKV